MGRNSLPFPPPPPYTVVNSGGSDMKTSGWVAVLTCAVAAAFVAGMGYERYGRQSFRPTEPVPEIIVVNHPDPNANSGRNSHQLRVYRVTNESGSVEIGPSGGEGSPVWVITVKVGNKATAYSTTPRSPTE
jgi:hypothetical protein